MDDFVKKSIAMRGDMTCPIAMAAEVLSDQWTVIVLCDIGLLSARGDVEHTQRKIYSITEPALGLLPIMVGMAEWSLSQENLKAQQFEFLKGLYSPKSQAMAELIDELRITHAIE